MGTLIIFFFGSCDLVLVIFLP